MMQREGQLRKEGVRVEVREPYKKPELKRYGRLEDVVQAGLAGGDDGTLLASSTF